MKKRELLFALVLGVILLSPCHAQSPTNSEETKDLGDPLLREAFLPPDSVFGPKLYGIQLHQSLATIQQSFPAIAEYTETDSYITTALPKQAGYRYFIVTPDKPHMFSNNTSYPFATLKIVVDSQNIVVLLSAESNVFSASMPGQGKDALIGATKTIHSGFVADNGKPYAETINLSDQNISNYKDIYACLWALQEVDNVAYRENSRIAAATGVSTEDTLNIRKTSEAAQQLYGLENSKIKPKTTQDYMGEIRKTCHFINRGSISYGKYVVGLAQANVWPTKEGTATIRYDLFDSKTYRLWNNARRAISMQKALSE